jgi:hypothetical protein
MSRPSILTGSLLAGVLLLSGCATTTTDPAPANSSDPVSESPAPPTEPTAASVIDLPDCSTVVPAGYDATFLGAPLNDPGLHYPDPLGVVAPSAPAAGATNDEIIEAATELRCIWRHPDADISFLSVEAARVSTEIAQERFDAVTADDYTCIDVLDGRQCKLVWTGTMYPVEEADTQFFRDGVLIRVQQANTPTSGLMKAVVEGIWG